MGSHRFCLTTFYTKQYFLKIYQKSWKMVRFVLFVSQLAVNSIQLCAPGSAFRCKVSAEGCKTGQQSTSVSLAPLWDILDPLWPVERAPSTIRLSVCFYKLKNQALLYGICFPVLDERFKRLVAKQKVFDAMSCHQNWVNCSVKAQFGIPQLFSCFCL